VNREIFLESGPVKLWRPFPKFPDPRGVWYFARKALTVVATAKGGTSPCKVAKLSMQYSANSVRSISAA